MSGYNYIEPKRRIAEDVVTGAESLRLRLYDGYDRILEVGLPSSRQGGGMADRPVTQTLKNSDGDITALCNPDESWSPRAVSEVIADIESGAHTYSVPSDLGDATIQVVDGPAGKYVRSYRDQGVFNNLDELPVGAGEIPVASWQTSSGLLP